MVPLETTVCSSKSSCGFFGELISVFMVRCGWLSLLVLYDLHRRGAVLSLEFRQQGGGGREGTGFLLQRDMFYLLCAFDGVLFFGTFVLRAFCDSSTRGT